MLMQPQSLESLSAEQLREIVASLMGHVTAKDAQIARHQTELKHSQTLCAKLTHENALLKRMKFAAQSERFNSQQRSLLEDNLAAVASHGAVIGERRLLAESSRPASQTLLHEVRVDEVSAGRLSQN